MTSLTRRQVFGTAAAAAAATTLSGAASAKAPRATGQAPGFYRRKVGEAQVTALLDGYIDVAHGFWTGIEQATVEELAAAAGLPDNGSIRIGVTSYLINQGDRLVLVDTGSADLFGPTAGKFLSALAAAGHTPDQVDDILITHMHPDHIGALLENGAAVFPNAQIHVARLEFDHWTSTTAQSNAPDFARPWFDAALGVKAAYDGRLNVFSGAPEVLPGLTAVPLHGHTPGHSGYRLSSRGEDLLIWGDACGIASVQFEHPEAGLAFDVDGATGKATRAKLLDMAAGEGVLVASAHLPFPSFGRVLRAGEAYAWQPGEYRFEV
ncbi:MBL fold metallo-hydrolase [Roseobacter sp. SK209-2-6]|uniref:MBL fold metallo-hydrolase n=1 Tax=Roseobacter sp. SK209-2-6 TaxID=388739 RepID=UPI0012F4BB73|nr:MBL fold metallo-hydrolase [Roseobacter sp. SK209-2-6]